MREEMVEHPTIVLFLPSTSCGTSRQVRDVLVNRRHRVDGLTDPVDDHDEPPSRPSLLEQTASGLSIYGRLRRLGSAPQIACQCTTADGAVSIRNRRQIASIANVCGPNLFDALCKCHKQTRSLRRWA